MEFVDLGVELGFEGKEDVSVDVFGLYFVRDFEFIFLGSFVFTYIFGAQVYYGFEFYEGDGGVVKEFGRQLVFFFIVVSDGVFWGVENR